MKGFYSSRKKNVGGRITARKDYYVCQDNPFSRKNHSLQMPQNSYKICYSYEHILGAVFILRKGVLRLSSTNDPLCNDIFIT